MRKKYCRIISAVLLSGVICLAAVFMFRPDWRFQFRERFHYLTAKVQIKEMDVSKRKLITADSDFAENSVSNQALLLINGQFPLEEEVKPDVAEYKNSGVWMNRCMMKDYEALAQDVQERFGVKLYIKSAYRSEKEQEAEYRESIKAAAAVGCSEHQAGLALDVYVPKYGGNAFIKTEAGQYVNRECSKYGFIIRYPEGKEAITGISFEPWHIRYVGVPHAEIIYHSGWTLEEYYGHLTVGKFYSYGNYLITRQPKENVESLSEGKLLGVSSDNQGNYVLTFLK